MVCPGCLLHSPLIVFFVVGCCHCAFCELCLGGTSAHSEDIRLNCITSRYTLLPDCCRCAFCELLLRGGSTDIEDIRCCDETELCSEVLVLQLTLPGATLVSLLSIHTGAVWNHTLPHFWNHTLPHWSVWQRHISALGCLAFLSITDDNGPCQLPRARTIPFYRVKISFGDICGDI